MQLPTHLMAGWCTANLVPGLRPRQRLFCMIAAAIPDLDGLSFLFGQEAFWNWHHKLGHNLTWCIVSSLALMFFSPHKIKSFTLYAAEFHLHLLMDVYGSGPGWGIYYYWPFSLWQFDNTHLSWEYFSWQNLIIAGALLAWVLGIICINRRTPLEDILPRLDRAIVARFFPPGRATPTERRS